MKWRGISEAEQEISSLSLSERLLEIRARTRELVRTENLQIQERSIRALEATGAAEKILPVGAQGPEFELTDSNGSLIRSTDVLSRGPLVVLFFRGRWCPYCIATVEAWQRFLPEMQKHHASLLAISPQIIKQNNLMAEQHRLSFPLLSDPGNRVAKQFGVAYQLPQDLQELNRRIFVNLEFINGDKSWELPMPATFLIPPDQQILFAEAHPDYTQRTEPQRVLDLLVE
jgi:peroxiredoxin